MQMRASMKIYLQSSFQYFTPTSCMKYMTNIAQKCEQKTEMQGTRAWTFKIIGRTKINLTPKFSTRYNKCILCFQYVAWSNTSLRRWLRKNDMPGCGCCFMQNCQNVKFIWHLLLCRNKVLQILIHPWHWNAAQPGHKIVRGKYSKNLQYKQCFMFYKTSQILLKFSKIRLFDKTGTHPLTELSTECVEKIPCSRARKESLL